LRVTCRVWALAAEGVAFAFDESGDGERDVPETA
jgi:hypothetical protein